MLLSLEQKIAIIESFPGLQKSMYKDGRINYSLFDSEIRRKQIIRELTPTGNGYIYGDLARELKERVDNRGWINIRDYNEVELRDIIEKVIKSFC